MGNIKSKLKDKDKIVNEIVRVCNGLIEEYNYEFLNDSFCDRIAMIYKDEMMNRYDENTIQGISIDLGLTAHVPAVKKDVCRVIADHYVARMKIIMYIIRVLDGVSKYVDSIARGPFCYDDYQNLLSLFDNNAPRQSKQVCRIKKEYIDIEDERIKPYMEDLMDKFVNTSKFMLNQVQFLKDYDQTIDDEKLKRIKENVDLEIEKLKSNLIRNGQTLNQRIMNM
jgi:hypothetical protein